MLLLSLFHHSICKSVSHYFLQFFFPAFFIFQGSRSSSIPATPAPTPNPLLHVTYHMVPEQLAAGISNLKVDEGVDSSSFPGTPAPSPFSPSPAQFSGE